MNRFLIFGGLAVLLSGLMFWLWTPDKSSASLYAKYLLRQDDLVDLNGVQLHVRDSGPRDAPAIVLLHGLGSSLHSWDGWAQALESRYRVIRLDLPGSGLSPPDPAGDYTDARVVGLLKALLERLGVERAYFAGNSIGGRIAWSFAAAHTGHVAGLVLVSPDGFASPGFEYGVAPKVPLMMQAMRFVLPKWMLRANVEIAYADKKALTDAAMDRYYDLMLAPGNRAALLARMEQTVLAPPETRLRSIKAPVLLLWGEKDAMIPIANAEDYLRNLADAKLVRLPALGHVPQEENPDTSVAPVLKFLDHLNRSGNGS